MHQCYKVKNTPTNTISILYGSILVKTQLGDTGHFNTHKQSILSISINELINPQSLTSRERNKVIKLKKNVCCSLVPVGSLLFSVTKDEVTCRRHIVEDNIQTKDYCY